MSQKITKKQLNNWLEDVKPLVNQGKIASYIPALERQDPNDLAVSISYVNGDTVSCGVTKKTFTLQSVSKVISLALALMDHGEEYVFSKVGMEPTGDPFYSIAKLETSNPSKPLNPMINAGALAVTDMIKGKDVSERVERLLNFFRNLTGDSSIHYNTEVATSEFDTAFLNRSLSYFMKQTNIIKGDVEELLEVYCKQCAIEVTIEQLSTLGAVLANNGKEPRTGRELIPEHFARICKTFMVTCGMYDASGSFAIEVGIPAKSGVSGAILGSVKGFGGIGVYGPNLNEKGNSVVGLKLLKRISDQTQLSIF
ncbi:glutaminase A [Aquibacillus sediminis]|uniref:glutaminase A n=1 Tax=Aquibacillus sediminis TaxID=2574734 RepID=UPI0011095241|nr:glutaminase A [Aquibacillus sediminis]